MFLKMCINVSPKTEQLTIDTKRTLKINRQHTNKTAKRRYHIPFLFGYVLILHVLNLLSHHLPYTPVLSQGCPFTRTQSEVELLVTEVHSGSLLTPLATLPWTTSGIEEEKNAVFWCGSFFMWQTTLLRSSLGFVGFFSVFSVVFSIFKVYWIHKFQIIL